MTTLKETLYNHISEYVKPLKELVACDTQVIGHGVKGGNEANGQAYLKKLLEDLGADKLEMDPMDEALIKEAILKYQEGNPDHQYHQRENLYATFLGSGDKHLIFNGHVDTMPMGNPDAWQTPPLVPTEKEGKLYGLGACDMKGGLMAAIMAIKLLKESGEPLPCDVSIISVVDEEGGGNGSIQASMQGIKGDGVVVCEPTDDELILAHMGFVFFRVTVKGKANHSGAKWLGVSAIEKAMKVIHALEALEESWANAYQHPLLPRPSLNVGTIKGGDAASTVADTCQFEVCIHYLPEQMSFESVSKAFYEAIAIEDNWLAMHPLTVEMYQAGGGFLQDETHLAVVRFKEAYKHATQRKLSVSGSPAGCDSRVWRNIADIPTLQFGPGRLSECHAIDEYVEIEAYLEAILVYAEFIRAFSKEA